MIILPDFWLTILIATVSVLSVVLVSLDLISVRWAFPLDKRLSRVMSSHRTRQETRGMRLASLLGGPYGILGVALIGVVWLTQKGEIQEAAIYLATVFCSILYALVIKLLTARKRPSHGLEKQRTYAFPSAHSLASTVAYLALAFQLAASLEAWAAYVLISCATVLVMTVGISRIYLGVHYPSDVLGGFIAGGVWVWMYLFLISAQ